MKTENIKGATPKNLIITDLPIEVETLSISKITRPKKGGKYYFLKGYNIVTKQGITVTLSDTFVTEFGFTNLIYERNFVNEGIANLVLKVELVHVPNDGKQYGYVNKKTGTIEKYRNVGCYVVRDIVGNLDSNAIRKAEVDDIIKQSATDIAMLKAKNMFQSRKGRPYVGGVNADDDEAFERFYLLCNK